MKLPRGLSDALELAAFMFVPLVLFGGAFVVFSWFVGSTQADCAAEHYPERVVYENGHCYVVTP